jgi:hypothetical protein
MNGIDTGTYVELGAFQGRAESNSAFFDLCLGWKGLLIEGNPAHYSKLVQNRPHAHKMSFAPSCDAHFEAINKTVEFHARKFTNAGLPGQALGLRWDIYSASAMWTVRARLPRRV